MASQSSVMFCIMLYIYIKKKLEVGPLGPTGPPPVVRYMIKFYQNDKAIVYVKNEYFIVGQSRPNSNK